MFNCEICATTSKPRQPRIVHCITEQTERGPRIVREVPVCQSCKDRLTETSFDQLFVASRKTREEKQQRNRKPNHKVVGALAKDILEGNYKPKKKAKPLTESQAIPQLPARRQLVVNKPLNFGEPIQLFGQLIAKDS